MLLIFEMCFKLKNCHFGCAYKTRRVTKRDALVLATLRYLECRWNNPLFLNAKELLFISEHRSLSCLTGCGRWCHWCQKQLIMNWIWAGQKGPTVLKWPQNHRKFQTHFFWEKQNIYRLEKCEQKDKNEQFCS